MVKIHNVLNKNVMKQMHINEFTANFDTYYDFDEIKDPETIETLALSKNIALDLKVSRINKNTLQMESNVFLPHQEFKDRRSLITRLKSIENEHSGLKCKVLDEFEDIPVMLQKTPKFVGWQENITENQKILMSVCQEIKIVDITGLDESQIIQKLIETHKKMVFP